MTRLPAIPNPESLDAYMNATPEERRAFFERSYRNIMEFRSLHPEIPFTLENHEEWTKLYDAWKVENER